MQEISNNNYDFDVYQLEDVEQRFQKAGWLMDNFSYLTGTDQSGALQIAIWEVTHEQNGTFNPYEGDFSITPDTGTPPNYDTLNSIIAGYNNATPEDFLSFNMNNFATYTSEQYQDLIGLNPTPTPEPGTILLFGSGIIGMGYLRMRKKRS